MHIIYHELVNPVPTPSLEHQIILEKLHKMRSSELFRLIRGEIVRVNQLLLSNCNRQMSGFLLVSLCQPLAFLTFLVAL